MSPEALANLLLGILAIIGAAEVVMRIVILIFVYLGRVNIKVTITKSSTAEVGK